jgi:hypothetical protein
MPCPRSNKSLLFKRSNVLEFFRQYKQDCKDYYVLTSNQLEKLLNYYTLSIAKTVKFIKQCIVANYDSLQKAMLKHYAKDNIKQHIYTTAFLDTY